MLGVRCDLSTSGTRRRYILSSMSEYFVVVSVRPARSMLAPWTKAHFTTRLYQPDRPSPAARASSSERRRSTSAWTGVTFTRSTLRRMRQYFKSSRSRPSSSEESATASLALFSCVLASCSFMDQERLASDRVRSRTALESTRLMHALWTSEMSCTAFLGKLASLASRALSFDSRAAVLRAHSELKASRSAIDDAICLFTSFISRAFTWLWSLSLAGGSGTASQPSRPSGPTPRSTLKSDMSFAFVRRRRLAVRVSRAEFESARRALRDFMLAWRFFLEDLRVLYWDCRDS
mmetsp:Transcript_18065/g.36197  ORF Transcript_18065/g.36197 Transcript_18065/m.36197 type:complete len:291 (+) Transcript_18065:135-1007(+)